MVASPKITIVIPNWNGRSMLEHCLHSLQSQSIDNFDVIVVDNGSVDGSVEFIRQEFPAVQCICLSQNTGFSHAVNCGIDAASADWILLLNNDMEVAEDCLERLVEALDNHPEFEFFALKMLDFGDRDYLDGAGDGVMRGGVGYRLGTMEQDQPYYRNDRETFGACAGAALYSRRFFAVAGLFDPDFFAYLEDVDLNLRARRCGLRCLYLADARVYHVGSATSGSKINPLTIRLSTRNNIWVIAKNYPALLFLRFFIPLFIYQLAWFLFCVKKKMVIPYVHGITAGMGGIKNIRAKGREQNAARQRIPLRQFGDLIVAGERDVIRSIMARRSSVGKGNLLLKIYSALFL